MIINKNKREVISKKEKYCKSAFSQGRGLMFSFQRKNLVMEFSGERKVCLHNWFVFYPIDVLVLDNNKEIVEIKKGFKPFRFWNSVSKGRYVIELGEKKDKKEYEVGDRLEIKEYSRRHK